MVKDLSEQLKDTSEDNYINFLLVEISEDNFIRAISLGKNFMSLHDVRNNKVVNEFRGSNFYCNFKSIDKCSEVVEFQYDKEMLLFIGNFGVETQSHSTSIGKIVN